MQLSKKLALSPSKKVRSIRIKTLSSQTSSVINTSNRSENVNVFERLGSASFKNRLAKVDTLIERARRSSKVYLEMKYSRKKSMGNYQSDTSTKNLVFLVIGKGNNEELVEKLLSERSKWMNSKGRLLAQANFVWGFLNSSQKSRLKNDVVKSRVSGAYQMTNKGCMYENIAKYCERQDIQLNFIPITFYLNRQTTPSVVRQNVKQFVEFFSYVNEMTTLMNVWILKPTNMNQGRDIHLFNSLHNLVKILCRNRLELMERMECLGEIGVKNAKQREKVEQMIYNYITGHKSLILQKYIENPLLIEGMKFDIRVWMLLDQNEKIYIFEQGYLRFSSQEYKLDDDSLKDYYKHLTNHSLQKHSEKYDSDKGIRRMTVLRQFLKEKGREHCYDSILIKIKEIIVLTARACIASDKANHGKNFEIFGFDFMLDRQLNVRLIEANSNPAITQDNAILSLLVPKMLNDAFKLTLDKIFNSRSVSSYPVEGLSIENGWVQVGALEKE